MGALMGRSGRGREGGEGVLVSVVRYASRALPNPEAAPFVVISPGLDADPLPFGERIGEGALGLVSSITTANPVTSSSSS